MVTPTLNNRRRVNGMRNLLSCLRRNPVALLALLMLLLIVLWDQPEFNDYYDLGTSFSDTLSDSLSSMATSCSSAEVARASSTTTIVETNDPQLHETATVMAMATGYSLFDYQVFVGSLRKTGFLGNIILVVSPDIASPQETYLKQQNVILHKVQYANCSHPLAEELSLKNGQNKHHKELVTCVHPYPELKHRWARFPLLRDLLKECGGQPNPELKCGGPVLITDMRDTFFQRNPFGPEAPKVHGLQVFQEHYTIRTTHWLVKVPVSECKGVTYDEPMLCSGTTIGTRQAMLDYLDIFHNEMNVWMQSPKCCCNKMNGDDQSMHNYLYYSGMLDTVAGGVTAVKNRDGLVHTVGAMGSLIRTTHHAEKNKLREAMNHPQPKNGIKDPYDLSTKEDETTKNWLGLHYGLTDTEGFFVQFDGSRSYVVHQWDRFGRHLTNWLLKNKDSIYT